MNNFTASLYHIDEALKSKDSLSKETLAALKIMKDMIKTQKQNMN
jgi:hypothetical protein